MKTVKITVTQQITLRSDAEIVEQPDEDNPDDQTRCLRIGNDCYIPTIHWLKYGREDHVWSGGIDTEEEILEEIVTEDANIEARVDAEKA